MNLGNRPSEGDETTSRRGFLIGTLAAGLSLAEISDARAAALNVLAGNGVSVENNGFPQLNPEDLKAHPEKLQSVEVLDALITLNFFDFVLALAKSEADHGEIPEEKKSRLAHLRNGKQSGLNSLLAFPLELLSRFGLKPLSVAASKVSAVDRHFPHVNLLSGFILNILRATCGPKAKQEVIHGLEEMITGVGLLVTSTSVGGGIRLREKNFMDSIHIADQKIMEDAGERFDQESTLVAKINDMENGIAEVVGAAPFAAALCQVPLFAFGSAEGIARNKMEDVKKLCDKLFSVFEGQSVHQTLQLVEQIKNPVIAEIIRKFCKNKKTDVVFRRYDQSEKFTAKDVQRMSEEYFAQFGIGMLSGTMDVTQAAFGDVGPAIIGAYQSFDGSETLKTGLANILYTIVMGFEETCGLAWRLGIPYDRLWNEKSRAEAYELFINSWRNLYCYASGAKESPKGAKFGVLGQLGEDTGNIFRMGFQGIKHLFMRGGKVDDILARRSDHELEEFFGGHHDALVTTLLETQKTGDTAEGLSKSEVLKRAKLVMAGIISLEEAQKSGDLDVPETRKEIDVTVEKHMDEVRAILKESDEDMNDQQLYERSQKLLGELHGLLEILKRADFSNQGTAEEFTAKLQEIAHFLNSHPQMFDLFSFEYWEKHLGPTIAETAFVPAGQGLHLVGVMPMLNRAFYQNDAFGELWQRAFGTSPAAQFSRHEVGLFGSMLIHTANSALADNWADLLVHAKQLPEEFFFPKLAEEYGLSPDFLDVDLDQNVLDKFIQFVERVEKKFKDENQEGKLNSFYDDVWDAFLITKFISENSAVLGGGETTIGNSPHFRALVGELKRLITLGGSIKDIYTHFQQHIVRLALTFINARLVGPAIEKYLISKLFGGNPFRPENRKKRSKLVPPPGNQNS